MEDERTAKWSAGFQAIDHATLLMASELEAEFKSGSWKTYTFAADYPEEHKQGTHPRTFGSFLEGHSFDLRQRGHEVSRGELETLVDIYRWSTSMGATVQHMAYIGLLLLRQIHRQYKGKLPEEGAKILAEAIESKNQHGSYYLPSFAPEGKVSFTIETQEQSDGTYQLLALIVSKDGVRYKNRWPKALVHYLTKRLRASHITRE